MQDVIEFIASMIMSSLRIDIEYIALAVVVLVPVSIMWNKISIILSDTLKIVIDSCRGYETFITMCREALSDVRMAELMIAQDHRTIEKLEAFVASYKRGVEELGGVAHVQIVEAKIKDVKERIQQYVIFKAAAEKRARDIEMGIERDRAEEMSFAEFADSLKERLPAALLSKAS